jgi:hypothetical protein
MIHQEIGNGTTPTSGLSKATAISLPALMMPAKDKNPPFT